MEKENKNKNTVASKNRGAGAEKRRHAKKSEHAEDFNDENSLYTTEGRMTRKGQIHAEENIITTPIIALLAVVALLVVFNQIQINGVNAIISSGVNGNGASLDYVTKSGASDGGKDLSNINIDELKSTGHTLAAVFPVEDITSQEDALAIIFPTGTPDYGEELGVSFDDPVGSLETLSKMFRPLKAEVEKNNPGGFKRYMSLASKPVGISCEYCCGLSTIGIDKNGNSACGCQHNPALLTIALYLSTYSDYTDGEILREVMRWKTLFFPKDMIGLGMTVAGGDTSSLEQLPGMVGGC